MLSREKYEARKNADTRLEKLASAPTITKNLCMAGSGVLFFNLGILMLPVTDLALGLLSVIAGATGVILSMTGLFRDGAAFDASKLYRGQEQLKDRLDELEEQLAEVTE